MINVKTQTNNMVFEFIDEDAPAPIETGALKVESYGDIADSKEFFVERNKDGEPVLKVRFKPEDIKFWAKLFDEQVQSQRIKDLEEQIKEKDLIIQRMQEANAKRWNR